MLPGKERKGKGREERACEGNKQTGMRNRCIREVEERKGKGKREKSYMTEGPF